MARRKEVEDLVRVTLNLYETDYQQMLALHPNIGAAKAIRQLVRNYLARVAESKLRRMETLETEIDFDRDI